MTNTADMTNTATPAGGAHRSSRPSNVLLGPGAAQNWSDLEHSPAGSSAAHRAVLAQVARPEHRVVVLGPHCLDLIVGLADQVSALTVIIRSIPDAVTIGNALADREHVDVICADAATLATQPEPYDVVVALDDLTRVWSSESEPTTWAAMYAATQALLAPGGTLLLAVENELGLAQLTSLHSRYTSDRDEDWSVTATFDDTRPRSSRALAQVAASAGHTQILGALPTWQEQTVLISEFDDASAPMTTLLGALTLGSPAYRRVGADPSRVTRAAVLSGRLAQLCSGWLLITGSAPVPGLAATTIIADDLVDRAATYVETGERIVRRVPGAPDTELSISDDARLLSGLALDACAAQDLPGLRELLGRYRSWLVATTEQDGTLPAAYADTRLDNVLLDSPGSANFTALAPGDRAVEVDTATWSALADLVLVIRARGARHPWPVATDDATMLATLGAMVGLPGRDAPQDLLPAGDDISAQLPAHDVPGLLAVIERLTETNAALSARSRWFEERLNIREREMRVRAERHAAELKLALKQQSILQASAEDLRRSITYRTGAALINPIRKLGGNLRP
ncbi:class I SAM-dependent methyltransferase [Dermatophilaceae bacterium Sec6.4]